MTRTLVAITVITLVAMTIVTVCAAVPPMINYQGKLMQPSGVPVPDGTYELKFAIYDVPTGGTALWSETNPSVQVKGGLFSVLLGSVNNLPANIFDSADRFFGVTVVPDPEMTPRQQIASVAYAQMAGTIPDGSVSAAKLSDMAVTAEKIADEAITGDKIASGTIAADKLAPGIATPPGTILMWSGAVDQIPQGWALCDGQNGTPDLRGRFVVGAGAEYVVGAIGGEKSHQLTVSEMPTHSHVQNPHGHGITDPGHTHPFHGVTANYDDGPYFALGTNRGYGWLTIPASTTGIAVNSSTATNQNTGGDQPHENRPPYYALCFIMKLGY